MIPRLIQDVQIAINEASLYGSSRGASELDSLVALVVEDHGQNQRRHDAGDDSGSYVTEKLNHGYFLQWSSGVYLFWIRRRAATRWWNSGS